LATGRIEGSEEKQVDLRFETHVSYYTLLDGVTGLMTDLPISRFGDLPELEILLLPLLILSSTHVGLSPL
jgi:hypothetical protein